MTIFREIFSIFYTIIYVESTHKNRLDEAILMSTHNLKFHKIKKISLYICFLELSEEFHDD